MSLFEALMILCFGTAWPFSIFKSFYSRRNTGKSVVFLYIILAGYVSGCVHKLRYDLDPVIWLYVMNTIMVFADICLYHRNSRYERTAATTGAS